MREVIENGARLAWLIDSESRGVEVYRPDGGVEVLTNAEILRRERPIEGYC